jgi:dTDP-4-amino-4,6-dideoxygalactose transaminase
MSRLGRLEQSIEARRALVRAYRERLSGIAGVTLTFDDEDVERSSHFAFPVLVPDRDAREHLRASLSDDGVQTTWYPALHRFTDYAAWAPPDGLPQATAAAERHCALPLSPTMELGEVELVVDAVRRALA